MRADQAIAAALSLAFEAHHLPHEEADDEGDEGTAGVPARA